MSDAAIHFVRPTNGMVRRGLACLLGGMEHPGGGRGMANDDPRLLQFEQYAQSSRIDLSRQVVAVDSDDRAISTCLWLLSPGRTALLFTPAMIEFPELAEVTAACVREALNDAKMTEVVLAQSMIDPTDAVGVGMFELAGLKQLAVLNYMERKPPILAPNPQLPPGVELRPYSAADHPTFRRAIAASYEQTLDCPELAGVRDVEDVMAGHKSVGPFDPELWSAVMLDGQAVGVLLLAEVPARRALEVVYLGLAPQARGRGIGRALIHRVLAQTSKRGLALASLAVDASNVPAIRLYKRAGFVEVARRAAMIKKL